MSTLPTTKPTESIITLTKNPNTNKTTIFNTLTKSHTKITNYPNITIKQQTNTLQLENNHNILIINLPNNYNITTHSPNKKITHITLTKTFNKTTPNLTIIIIDTSNLTQNLYLINQLLDYNQPIIITLNIINETKQLTISINMKKLSNTLNYPIIPIITTNKQKLDTLKQTIDQTPNNPQTLQSLNLSNPNTTLIKQIQNSLNNLSIPNSQKSTL